jgi:hypothetical protein
MTIEHAHYGDIRDTLVRLPHGDPYGGMSYVRDDLFTVRHKLILELDPPPTSVFEFGALVGYFLVTALDAAPSIERVGWVDNESHSPGSNAMCEANVMATMGFSFNTSEVWWGTDRDDVHEMYAGDTFPQVPQYDLIAVDSDHSYDGELADLRAAHKLNPRWIFIDDWTAGSHGDDIQAATTTFLRETADHDSIYDLAEYVTVNGLAVLTRKEWA